MHGMSLCLCLLPLGSGVEHGEDGVDPERQVKSQVRSSDQ